MMKGKRPTKNSFRFDGEIKSFTENQKLVQHHQINFTRMLKGTSLSEKTKATTRNKKM